MPELPRLMPTSAANETFGGVTYHIDGELVPVLTVDVSQSSIYFEHHILLWKHSTIVIKLKQMQGALKRMMAGMQIFVTEASGPGMIAFSRDGAGHIVPIHLPQGRELEVREHQFLAATDAIDYSFTRLKGVANMLFGGTGFFIDKFHSHKGDGILWLHGYGCSRKSSRPARPSTSSRAAGSTRSRRCGWTPSSTASPPASSAPASTSWSTASPAQARSASSRCTSTTRRRPEVPRLNLALVGSKTQVARCDFNG